jgi:class 3 adenylate cyclase/predicted ATPase
MPTALKLICLIVSFSRDVWNGELKATHLSTVIRCPSCGKPNPDNNKFCGDCGVALALKCPSCGRQSPAGNRFCGDCGAPLTTTSLEAAPARSSLSHSPTECEAERRQLTVLFCDLVGSTALSTKLDPEDFREIVGAFHRCCAKEITEHGGFVARYMGDGVLAYFSYPTAHEDDAERAVRAGLALVAAVANLDFAAGTLRVRVGIATGLVVVGEIGEGGSREYEVVGETPNLAAWLQKRAEPDTVVIAAATRRLLGGLFEYRILEAEPVKGVGDPVPAWQVTGARAVESRFEALHGSSLTPLVGREPEIALLLERWERAKEGDGQVVLLSGEPGIGKSRIIQELRDRLSDESYTRLSLYCSPYHMNSPLYPVIGHLERAAGFDRTDTAEAKLNKLEALLASSATDLQVATQLLATVLTIATDQRYPPLTFAPLRQKQRTLEVLVEQLAGLAGQRPVLAVYEDSHWIDPSTIELLDLVIQRVQRLPALVVITFRPEFIPPWTSHAHVTRLSLSRLTRRHGSVIAQRVTSGKVLPAEVLEQIVSRADGVPLFVEELTKAVVESGLLQAVGGRFELAGPLPPLAIPTTLYDSLMARLDRFAPIKEVAQIAAVIGREFSYQLLAAVVDIPEKQLDQALGQLIASELVFQRGTPPEAMYSFKHALVQDTAYQSLLRSKRPQLHAKIARTIEQRFPEIVEARPELLAHHFTEAGLALQAIIYWQRAGERDLGRSAYAESISHLKQGLELLEALPGRPERFKQELSLRLTLGSALTATRGYASPEVGKTYLRARELCHELGEAPPQLFPVMHGLYRFYHVRGELQAARENGEQLLELAAGVQDSGLLIEAYRALGVPLFWLGDVTSALEKLERGSQLYQAQKHRSHASVFGTDPGVVCQSYAALALWHLGHPEQGCIRSSQALALARNLSHHHSIALALVWAAWLHQLRREPQAARGHAEAAIALCTEQGFPLFMPMGAILRGWALVQEGRGEEGSVQMRQSLADLRATGAGLWQPTFLSLIAEADGRIGQTERGLGVLDEAFAIVDRNNERFYEAELHRLKGELLLLSTPADLSGAERCYQFALEIAQRQMAKSLGLRAALSLARLWAKEGRRSEARNLLAPIYGWFIEGFDTPDYKEANSLLEELHE